MRSFLLALGLLAGLLFAAPAQAQFANRGMGLSLGYMNFNRTAGLDGGFVIGFEASLYLEHRFELISLSKLVFPEDPGTGRRLVGFAPSLGVRYLLLEESIRPYLGADISYLYIFRGDQPLQYVGIGPNAGIEFFVIDWLSLGARGQYNVYLALNEPVQTSLIGAGVLTLYF
jgi:outer membrane protein